MKKNFYVTCYLNKSHPGYEAGMEKAEEVNCIALEEGGVGSLKAMDELLNQAISQTDRELYALCSVERLDGDYLSLEERKALRAVSEALVIIRTLAQQPMTEAKQAAIHDLADAFHNIPDHLATIGQHREANAFLLDAGIERARTVYHQHGFRSQHLPPFEPSPAAEIESPPPSDFMALIGAYPGRLLANFFKPTEVKPHDELGQNQLDKGDSKKL